MEKRMGIFTPKNLTALDSNHMIAQQNYFGWLFVCLLLWQKNNPSSNVESPSVYVVQLNLFCHSWHASLSKTWRQAKNLWIKFHWYNVNAQMLLVKIPKKENIVIMPCNHFSTENHPVVQWSREVLMVFKCLTFIWISSRWLSCAMTIISICKGFLNYGHYLLI